MDPGRTSIASLIGLTLGWSGQSRVLVFKLIAIAALVYALLMLL
jgi:hypothetical protein